MLGGLGQSLSALVIWRVLIDIEAEFAAAMSAGRKLYIERTLEPVDGTLHMIGDHKPKNERDRLNALRAYELLDTEPCGMPIAV